MKQPIRREPATGAERGSSTAEFVIMLPAVVFILALVLGACAVGAQQIALEESARLGARAAARGESAEIVSRIVHEIDEDFTATLTESAGTVTVTSSAQTPGIIGQLGGWQQQAQASASIEHINHSEVP